MMYFVCLDPQIMDLLLRVQKLKWPIQELKMSSSKAGSAVWSKPNKEENWNIFVFFYTLTLYISFCSAVPDVEVKGERAVYFLLVQGADDVGSGTCRVRLMHSHSQLNGAAAMATLSSLLREKPFSSGILYDKTAVFLCQEYLLKSWTLYLFIFSCTEPLYQGNKLCPIELDWLCRQV